MMAGGSPDHSLIAANVIASLVAALRKTPCRVYDSDVYVRLSESRYVHPDVTVTCDERDIEADKETPIEYPRLIIEVLSPSTEMIDRGKKLEYYRQCSTIEQYLLVDSRRFRVEHYRREGNVWSLRMYEWDEVIELASLGMSIPVGEIYEKTRLLRDSERQ